jgi:hypothetical protein
LFKNQIRNTSQKLQKKNRKEKQKKKREIEKMAGGNKSAWSQNQPTAQQV